MIISGLLIAVVADFNQADFTHQCHVSQPADLPNVA